MSRRFFVGDGKFRFARPGFEAFYDDPQDRTKISFAENRQVFFVRAAGVVDALPAGFPTTRTVYFGTTFAEPPVVFLAVSREEWGNAEPRSLIVGDYIWQMVSSGKVMTGTPYTFIVFIDRIMVTQTANYPYGLPSADRFFFVVLGA